MEQEKLKDNLQKVRSVSRQILASVENAIERAVRDLDKKIENIETNQNDVQEEKVTKPKIKSRQKQSEAQNV